MCPVLCQARELVSWTRYCPQSIAKFKRAVQSKEKYDEEVQWATGPSQRSTPRVGSSINNLGEERKWLFRNSISFGMEGLSERVSFRMRPQGKPLWVWHPASPRKGSVPVLSVLEDWDFSQRGSQFKVICKKFLAHLLSPCQWRILILYKLGSMVAEIKYKSHWQFY